MGILVTGIILLAAAVIILALLLRREKRAQPVGRPYHRVSEEMLESAPPHLQSIDQSNGPVHEALRRKSKELTSMFEVASILARTDSFSEKITSVIEELRQATEADSVTLRVPDEQAGGLRLIAISGSQEFRDRPLIQPAPKGASVEAFETGRPLVTNDYPSYPLAEASAVAQGSRSMVSLPIMAGGKTMGVATLISKRLNHFDSERVGFLTAVTDGLGALLENSRLSQDLQSTKEEIAVADEVARILTSTLDIERVYEKFALELKKLVDFDHAGISLFDPSAGRQKIAYASQPDAFVAQVGKTLTLDGTMSQHVANTRQPLVSGDLHQETRFWTLEYIRNKGMRSMINVPVICLENVIGTLYLVSSRLNAYGEREQAIMERLAAQIAPAIRNSQLFQEVEQLALALDSTSDAVTFVDLDGNIQYVNGAFYEIFGYTREEVIGKNRYIGIPEDVASQDLAREIVSEGLKGGWRGEVKRVRKDGEVIDVFQTVTPVKNKDEEVFGLLRVSRDITASKLTEKRLKETARLTSIGELAAGVAHEINNPLTSVLGYSQLLMAADVPQAILNDLQIVYSEAGRAAKIVRNLLSFARRSEAHKTYMDIAVVIEQALEMKSYDIQSGGIQVTMDFAKDLPATMLDEQQLVQVILNILNNAEHAMRSREGGGQLVVRTSLAENHMRVSISDNGPGIEPEHLSKIFEPFFTTKGVGQGTGLGLSISYGIVRQHGGDIWAESILGEGTTFHIEIPVVGPEADDAPQCQAPPVSAQEPKHVLVVDDKRNIPDLLSRSL